jgi:hypothetical protein
MREVRLLEAEIVEY